MLPWLLIACSDDPAAEGETAPELAPIEVPAMTVAEPARGAFTGEGDNVAVSGKVTLGSAPLTSMAVNGQKLDISARGGSFDGKVPVAPGVNILGFRVDASDTGRAVDGRAVMAGEVWDPADPLADTVKIQLGPEGLDDDKADIDDLAAIAEAVMADPTLLRSFVGYEMPTDYYTITLTDADMGRASVDIESGNGELYIDVTVSDLWVAFDIAGVDWYDWLSTTGEAGADTATLSIVLELSADGGEVRATPTSTSVRLSGFWVTVDWFPDSMEDDLADWTQATLEETVADTVTESIETLVADYLSAFAADFSFSGFDMHVALSSLRCAEDGLRLTLDAWVDFRTKIDLPRGAGSLRTDGDGPGFPLTTTEPFAAAADDDLLHQLLFAFWASGSTSGIEFDGLTLQVLAGDIPPPLGPVSAASVEVNLPVTLGKPTYDDMDIDLSIGEMRLKITREDGEKIDASVNLRTGATVAIDDDGEVGITLDERPAYMTLEVGMEASPRGLDPGDMAALVRLSVPPLLGTVASFMPDIPVPDIPLDSFADSLSGQSLGIADPAVRVDDGWLVIEGALEER
ncbi:MAG: hypothetical protein FJ090_04805 [Deltaproteobacteria bacterium]|nr:hypothetical protein [Deltaproteobacteria bacterium]